jgi:hypothetical protein
MQRSARPLIAIALGGAVLLAPQPAAPQAAQAAQMVAAIAKYVGLTAGLGEALETLAVAVGTTYETGRGIADDLGCRAQQRTLQELVITLRDLQVEKQHLHTSLSRAVHFGRGPGDWAQLRQQAERVSIRIQDLEEMIDHNKQAFAGNAALSRAYVGLLVSFDAKEDIVRDLVAEMAEVDWTWHRLDRHTIAPHLEVLEQLEGALQVEIAVISEATDTVADYAGDLCQRA